MLAPRIEKLNNWLTQYLHHPGDDEETLLQKKIWWLIHFAGIFVLAFAILLVYDSQYGRTKDAVDSVFLFALPFNLLLFHFYRKGIEGWALYSQISLVVICSLKTYLMGGLLLAGAPIFIGLLGPVYALILPKKKRAIFVYLLYLGLMLGATFFQSSQPEGLSVPLYTYGFTLGITQVFLVLFYFTTQVDKLKQIEKKRMQELDEFKTKFYTNITHEFRTPLTIINGMAEQVQSSPAEWLGEGIEMIKRNGQKLLNLTNQMLALSKLEANAMPVNLVQDDVVVYLKYLVESFDSLAKSKNIHLVFSATPEEIKMDFDPDKMQDVLSNLISNAIKFSPEKSKVEVRISKQEKSLRDWLKVSVRDYGGGISKEYLPRVFDRYFQAENQHGQMTEGTGLGLALTRELVKLLGGEIEAKSELGKGTIFTMRLPISNEAEEMQPNWMDGNLKRKMPVDNLALSTSEDDEMQSEKLLLLIVEDNPDVVNYLRSLLSEKYRIEVAGNGQEGFEKATDLIPDLVISDVMMPVMDGFAFCKKIKTDLRTSHIPVVMLTAKADADSKVEGLESGADAYLSKPFNREELFIRIKKLIELRQMLQARYRQTATFEEVLAISEHPIFKKEDTFLQDVRQLLEAHLSDEEFGIAELCRSLGMSRSQLYRKFKALTDTTVHHFIRNLRLNKAKSLLLTTDLNVTEVAFETGFKNLSHFSRIFMKKFGSSPSQYRQQQILDNQQNIRHD